MQLPDLFSASSLLSVSPVFMPASEAASTLITTLSPAGIEFIFTHGRAALIDKLLAECTEPADRARAASIRWYFADPEAKLPDLVVPQKRPVLPDVIGRDAQQSKRVLYLYVLDSLAWFDGHFPGDPILPAVIQIDWVIHFGTTCDRKIDDPKINDLRGEPDPDHFSGFHRLKFFSVIEPNTVLRLTLDVADATLQFTLESRTGLHSQGKILFQHGDNQG